MNHELIMLREYKRIKNLSQYLTEKARYKAIKSYCGMEARGGTIGQIEEICRLISLRNGCLLFCAAVNDAFKVTDVKTRALLSAVYLKREKIDALAARFNVSRSTVYRKLFSSRAEFKRALNVFGYTEEWFLKNYSQIDFIAERLVRKDIKMNAAA